MKDVTMERLWKVGVIVLVIGVIILIMGRNGYNN